MKRKETKRDNERQKTKLRTIDKMTEIKQCISQASVRNFFVT